MNSSTGEVLQVVIYHNPNCSKSRKTLDLLQSKNIEPRIIEYLKSPPTHQELAGILQMLDLDPKELIRSGESEFRENGLDDPTLPKDQLIDAMIEHPILMQRPIVVCNGRAAIGRPPENVLEIL